MSYPRQSRRRPSQRQLAASQQRTKATIAAKLERAAHWAVKKYEPSSSPVTLWQRIRCWLAYPSERSKFNLAEREFGLTQQAFETLVAEKCQGFPWLAEAWGDYLLLGDQMKALFLQTKPWPAQSSAEIVKETASERRQAAIRARVAEYIVAYYEKLFPWLTDFRSDDVDELLISRVRGDGIDGSSDDPARTWLTEAEYERLPTAQRYQLALDRYWKKPKTRWELGRDYERYIGYRYETDGFEVGYQGIVEGFADLGRDLVATKGSKTEIVQCKYWSSDKTIHEKHIFQLFGTLTAFRLDNPAQEVSGVFATSTGLSPRARSFAEALGIRVQEGLPLEDYPVIKCNVSRRTGEKIYHLPFDQQYDSTLIEAERLECYARTVAEAESLGFRRALRWLGRH